MCRNGDRGDGVLPPSDLRIEPATENDLAVILQLIRALAEYERLGHAVVATERDLRETLFGPKPSAEVILARAGQEAVGFAVWFSTYSTFLARPGLYVEDVFVCPEWRGRGIGRALLTYLARVAVARNYGRMEWSVLDWNEPAIRFYRRLGATPMDDWTVFRLTGDALTELGSAR
jgi:GNAT superfamily N-acetyltransferase